MMSVMMFCSAMGNEPGQVYHVCESLTSVVFQYQQSEVIGRPDPVVLPELDM